MLTVDMQPTEEAVTAKASKSVAITRDKCKECGCEASYISCKCPTKKTLDCALEAGSSIVDEEQKPVAPEVGPVQDSVH